MIYDQALLILSGAFVGFFIGLTGVGGGSLMTPILLLFGFPAQIAVGTDLLYAAITKAGGIVSHHKQSTIQWKIVGSLACGSIPGSILTILFIDAYFTDAYQYQPILTTALGFMLFLTSLVILFLRRIQRRSATPSSMSQIIARHSTPITSLMGLGLGILVTLSSVGAGAFGAAILLMIYTRTKSIVIVGTDIAHAVPLTLVAGIGHLYLGHVDFSLLAALVMGSLPAIVVGTRLGQKIPDRIMRPLLGSSLLAISLKLVMS